MSANQIRFPEGVGDFFPGAQHHLGVFIIFERGILKYTVSSFPAVAFTVKSEIYSVGVSWITEWCLSGCWTKTPPTNLKATVQLQIAHTPLKMIS